ncbi:MAG: NAD(P)-binding domain-containing protein, partial [Candidatus Eremiobacteraeota bacterium]|nr:NAD(P)-binding domain-containing protein [Candidatus Eremiobacteraeota bacterium]
MSEKQKIAFIGLGTMGGGMAANLLAAGYSVTGYNRTPAKAEALRGKGLSVAASARDAVRDADVVVTMLPDNPAVESTLLRDGGAIAAAKRGTLFIDSSTVSRQRRAPATPPRRRRACASSMRL